MTGLIVYVYYAVVISNCIQCNLESIMVSMRKGLLVALLALAAAPVMFAQTDITGKDAPDFKATECINQPEATTLNDCAGEVVLIKYWGTN